MYKQLAAYSAALIATEQKYIPLFALGSDSPIWGLTRDGQPMYRLLRSAHKLSIVGAMRCANDELLAGTKAYNNLDRLVRHTALTLYGRQYLSDLSWSEAYSVLITVARG